MNRIVQAYLWCLPVVVLLLTVASGSLALAAAPTLAEAEQLCQSEYTKCWKAGNGGLAANPYSTVNCDNAKEFGDIDIATWKRCRDWCDARVKKCLADAAVIFGAQAPKQ